MKTYEVVQRYTNVAHARRNQKMITPIVLGRYQAATIASAINKAAKEWQVPAIVLGASLVKEVVKAEADAEVKRLQAEADAAGNDRGERYFKVVRR